MSRRRRRPPTMTVNPMADMRIAAPTMRLMSPAELRSPLAVYPSAPGSSVARFIRGFAGWSIRGPVVVENSVGSIVGWVEFDTVG